MTTTNAAQQVEARLKAFYDAWMQMSYANGEGFSAWWSEYFSKDCAGIVRASGNPLSSELWCKMISSDDVNYCKDPRNKLVSIDSCVVFANGSAAVTVMTVDLVFSYKENFNEDRAKISLTWSLEGEDEKKWKIIHFQRATGQPIPSEESS